MQLSAGRLSSSTRASHSGGSKQRAAAVTARRGGGATPARPRPTRAVAVSAAAANGGGDNGTGSRGGPTGLNVAGHRPTSLAGWELMKQALRDAGVKIVAPQEVAFAQRGGGGGGAAAAASGAATDAAAVIVDVRPEALHRAGHLRGAVNVPYYRPIEGWSPWQVARRIGYAAFGVFNGTEVNPNFADEVEAVVGGDKARPVVLYCSQGGSLDPTASRARGFQTRSLVAAYELTLRGFTSVSVMKGGFFEWQSAGRDVAGDGGEPAAGGAEEGGGSSSTMARN